MPQATSSPTGAGRSPVEVARAVRATRAARIAHATAAGSATGAPAMPAQQVHLDLLDRLTDVIVRLKRRTSDPESAARMFLLSHVERHAPVRATEVADHAGLDLSTVSRHLRALEDEGLVERSPDPDDRRATLLELSADGRAALDRALRTRAEAVAAATHDWTPTELSTLEHLLARLADDLETPL